MTELQVKAATLAENVRHDKATEKLTKQMNTATKQHYQAQDTYTAAHYERSDTAGMISANASAINAQASATNAETSRKKYQMDYDIEYGYTGTMYGQDANGNYIKVPLSAQEKIANIEQKTLEPYTYEGANITGYFLDKNGKWQPSGTTVVKTKPNTFVEQEKAQREAKVAETKASTANKNAGAVSSILNSTFGKQGVVKSIVDLVDE